MTPQDMDIIAARDLKVGDVILDGQRKPYVERTVREVEVLGSGPMVRVVQLEDEYGIIGRTYKIDDYVAIAPRVTNEAVAA